MKFQNAKDTLMRYDVEYGFTKQKSCTQFENEQFAENEKMGIPLPQHVWRRIDNGKFTGQYSKLTDSGLSDNEKLRVLMYHKIKLLTNIHNILIFFAVVLALNLIGSFLLMFFG